MPPSTHHAAACALESYSLPQPPAVLRELHRSLSSDWPERALRLPAVRAATAAASSLPSLAANVATSAASSAAQSTAAVSSSNGHTHSASASSAPLADSHAHVALLPALIALLSEPVQIGCRTCTQRAKESRRSKLRGSQNADAAASDAASGIHQRLRLSLESPALQLHFLQFARRTLFAPAQTPSQLQPAAHANGTRSPLLNPPARVITPPASFISLIRRFASEIDWRIDESAALAKSGLEPPPVFLPSAATAAASSIAPSTFANYVDPRFESGGMFVSTPCALVAGRGFDHHAQILEELRTLSMMVPELRTMVLPARQERYFKHGELGQSHAHVGLERQHTAL